MLSDSQASHVEMYLSAVTATQRMRRPNTKHLPVLLRLPVHFEGRVWYGTIVLCDITTPLYSVVANPTSRLNVILRFCI